MASQSSRRQKLLTRLGLNIKVKPAEIDESIPEGADVADAVTDLALKKARKVADPDDSDEIVIGADTVVVYDGVILGKPVDEHDAFCMLNMLSGSWHDVYTGIAVVSGRKEAVDVVRTRVKFRELSGDEIEAYIQTGEPMDKAGSYGIQDIGAIFVENIEGDYFNVVGLPVCKLTSLLKEEFGINIL